MFVEKEQVLTQAPDALNKTDQPWGVTVEGDSIWGGCAHDRPNELY